MRNQKFFFATEERENSRVRKTLPHPEAFVCAPYSTVEMPPRILAEYPARSIYIAGSNRVIDNRQDFIFQTKMGRETRGGGGEGKLMIP